LVRLNVAAGPENCHVACIVNIIKIQNHADPRLEPYSNIRERDLVYRHNAFIAEGKVVLNVLLSSQIFEAVSVLVLESRLAGIVPILEAANNDIPVYVVDASLMEHIAGFSVHRGVLAIGRKRFADKIDDLSAFHFNNDALVVVVAGVSNHDNVGAIFRNAAAFGADAVFLDEESCDPLYRKSIRVSVGAVLKVPFLKSGPLNQIADALIAHDFMLAALSPGGTQSITGIPKFGRRALLLGSEGQGLPQQLLSRLNAWTIPMAQDFDSLNVATASGIALFHASGYSAGLSISKLGGTPSG
jgi:tRNA G18 (ribose-2'-O)-methylase SpoU